MSLTTSFLFHLPSPISVFFVALKNTLSTLLLTRNLEHLPFFLFPSTSSQSGNPIGSPYTVHPRSNLLAFSAQYPKPSHHQISPACRKALSNGLPTASVAYIVHFTHRWKCSPTTNFLMCFSPPHLNSISKFLPNTLLPDFIQVFVLMMSKRLFMKR